MARPDKLTDTIRGAAVRHGLDGDAILLAAAVDMAADGSFHETWLVTDGRKLAVGDVQNMTVYPLREMESFETQAYVGNGLVVAKFQGEYLPLCRYSNTHARKMAIVVRVLNKLAQGEPVTDEDFYDDERPQVCPKCGRPFPERRRQLCPHCLDRRALTLRVLSFFRGYEWHVAGIVGFMLAGSALGLLSPYINGRVLFDEVLTPGGRYEGKVVPVILLMAFLQLLSIGFNIAHQWINAKMTSHVIARLKSQVFEAMQRLHLGFFTSKQTGGLMVRVNSDAGNLQYFFHDGVPYFIVNSMQIVGIVGMMLYLNWRLALLLLIPIPLLIYYMKRSFPTLWRLFSRRHHKLRAMTSVVNDALTGVRVVKAFGREQQEIERFGERNFEVYEITRQVGSYTARLWPTMTLMINAGGLIVWAVGGWDVLDGRISLGTLITFTLYVGMLYGPLEFMTHIIDWWTNCINSAQRIFEILDSVPDVLEKPDAVSLRPMRGDVELRDVHFSYEPNKPILKGISFSVRAGEVIGIVGRSGAGKSTLANLISRLYDVDKGAILIDGVDVRDVKIQDLRDQIGMVLQDTYLFRGSVAENIAYAKPDASPEEILRAAKIANAHDFIMKLPDAYETVIGFRGQNFSGGERQRLSIARTVLHNPKILILDEATASVDTQTERQVQEALERLVKGRTTFSIAHRLSTLRNADRLIVIDKGELVEIGTHEELEAAKGLYHNLRTKQEEALAIRGVAND